MALRLPGFGASGDEYADWLVGELERLEGPRSWASATSHLEGAGHRWPLPAPETAAVAAQPFSSID